MLGCSSTTYNWFIAHSTQTHTDAHAHPETVCVCVCVWMCKRSEIITFPSPNTVKMFYIFTRSRPKRPQERETPITDTHTQPHRAWLYCGGGGWWPASAACTRVVAVAGQWYARTRWFASLGLGVRYAISALRSNRRPEICVRARRPASLARARLLLHAERTRGRASTSEHTTHTFALCRVHIV